MIVRAFAVYVVALGLTLAVETPVYALGLAAGGSVALVRAGRTGIRVNLVSHPLAFLVAFPLLTPVIGSLAALVLVEVGVVYLEAALVWRGRDSGGAAAIAVSCIANVASLLIGLALLH